MNYPRKQAALFVVVAICALAKSSWAPARNTSQALDDFIQRTDPAFHYEHFATRPGYGYTAHLISMTSQNWRSASEVNPTRWDHWVTIIVPDTVLTTTGLLHIEGGKSTSGPPTDEAIAGVAPIAVVTGAVLTVVQQIPMQPLSFADEPTPLRENALLAYSWDKVMVTGDPDWNALFPMTKASVRAMDVAQEYLRDTLGWSVNDFVVAGASKRGATAWLVAAVDARVKAVAPIVYPLLRFTEQLERHFESYGFYSEALADIEARDIFSRLRSPEGELLAAVLDPLRLRRRLRMPKYLLNGSGDAYFLPDSTQRFFDDLPGEKLQRIVPNANHSFDGLENATIEGLIAWYQAVLFGQPRPEIEWRWSAPARTLEVATSQIPQQVRLWKADNPVARDFRVMTLGPEAWTATVLTPDADGVYRAQVAEPAAGFTAFLVEISYPSAVGSPQVYSTSVYVTPDELPFELVDPVRAPRSAAYWRHQVGAALAGRPDDYTVEQLQDLLPVRVFGRYLIGVDDLERFFNHGPGRLKQARTNCMAARLNVETEEIGWYSDVTLRHRHATKFWRIYKQAESAYDRGQIRQASRLCAALNQQPAAPVPWGGR